MKIDLKTSTPRQYEYLEILFNDLGYNKIQRNAWLTDLFKRKITALLDLNKDEASQVIGLLKEQKESK
jgi:hypothetical protein